MTRFPLKGLTFIGGALFLAACVTQVEPEPEPAPVKQVQLEPMMERPATTAAEAAVLFRTVCLDQAPTFERSAQVLNQMPEIAINAESGYQHINLNVSFSLQGGDGNKRCTMIFNSDDDPDLVKAELNEVLSVVQGILVNYSPPPRNRNIFSITVQADPDALPQTESHPEAPSETPPEVPES